MTPAAFKATSRAKRFFVPEVVQTSEMDCGPAALKAILNGFGIPASYGRLREACQTTVDGTSIDTLEDLAVQLGLDAEQIMLPVDHLLLEESAVLPALVVTRLPNGLTHFAVAWDQQAGWVQMMDPGNGRRWVPRQRFLDELYIHHFPVSAAAWRAWAASSGFLAPLRRRLKDLEIPQATITELETLALADPAWRSLAALDAATRLTTSLLKAGAIKGGAEATVILRQLFDGNRLELIEGATPAFPIPPDEWAVQPIPAEVADDHLLLRGAVLVRIAGKRALPAGKMEDEPAEELPPELAAVLNEPPVQMGRIIWDAIRQDGWLVLAVLASALGLATLGITIQALLLQGLLRLGQSLPALSQRMAALIAFFAFLLALFLIDLPITAIIQRIGRRLEARLRIAFLEKIPRLSDRYFHSRLTSDMAQRAHSLRSMRMLPALGVSLLSTFFQLLLTALGVIWLQPRSAPLSIAATVVFVSIGWAARFLLEGQDARLRSHSGALSRFYLDALLGLLPLRTHSAERAFRRQHESLLVEWMHAGLSLARANVFLQGVGAIIYSLFAVWVVFDYANQGGAIGGALLLFYWTLNLPALGQSLAQQIQQIPMLRNNLLRVLEPLGTPDENTLSATASNEPIDSESETVNGLRGVAVEMRDLSIQAGGHTILNEINLKVAAGEHLAIVGPSGAGKSSLVGILLGWHRPATGVCLVDEQPLTGEHLPALRRVTAWVDPAIQLWNRTLLENLTYGNESKGTAPRGTMLEDADLFGVFERLENGLQTVLGEGGGLVSGGEGQRVRLGRAMNRQQPRLVILDEPFRGLDREQRRALLQKARQFWREATLICITHDVGETQVFERVLVIEAGRIAEDGAPTVLSAQPEARYHAMLEAEKAVRQGMWGHAPWRRFWIENGQLTELEKT